MADERIARRYAGALFATALQHDVVASVEADLNSIVGFIEGDEQFRSFVIAPYSAREEKLQILERMFSDRMTALTMQVLRVMLEKRREGEISGVRDEFVSLRRAHEGVLLVLVTSSEPIEEAQSEALLARLATLLGKKIEAEFRVEPHLIGGIKVAYGNYILDGSIRGTLRSLRDRLRHDLLKQQ